MIPGSNLLAEALDNIEPQIVVYRRALRRDTNAQHREVVVYAAPRDLVGSFQPIPVTRFQAYGLEAGKEYAIFYGFEPFAAPSREGPSDRLEYDGRAWDVKDVTAWLAQDGWEAVLLVSVGPIVEVVTDGE